MSTLDNRLDAEISPYLLAHAGNPVAWQPWDAQALAAARALERPILLSIGYSACHWCHVMAHESFEDAETAAVMNRAFVSIKVDREERPDLDRVYQLAHQALTGRGGGWPLTVFLTPDDRMPFFAGTYFPARPMHGMPAFVDLLQQIEAAWGEQRDAIRRQNEELARLLASLHADSAPRAVTRAPLDAAVAALEGAFDAAHGGFGGAPKFPQPGALALALEHSVRPQPEGGRARTIAEATLAAMAAGGIHDQVGGGFARYSVDARWEIPHFEKMLYDNGLLLGLYADAAVAFARPDFAAVARGIAEWALAEMRLPDGGLCASLDADSPGGEGRFYTWDRDEVAAVLAPADHALVARRLGLDREPNFEGRWQPVVAADLDTLAREFDLAHEAVAARLERAQATLYAARAEREWPARDDKVLTAWNALMAEGLASAGRRLDEPRYVDAALAAVDFLRARLWAGGQLYAVWRDGEHRQPAFLDDHAALLHALLALLQARWRDADLELARALADTLLARFADAEGGGFFQTAHDHEALPCRPKPLGDESVPGANGLAARALGRLGHLLGEPRYLEAARDTLAAAAASMEREPLGHATLLRALGDELEPPETVLLRGGADAVAERARRAAARFHPGRQVFALPPGAGAGLAALPEAPARGLVARRCRGSQCDLPETDAARIDALLA